MDDEELEYRYVEDFEWTWDADGHERSVHDVDVFILTWWNEIVHSYNIDLRYDTYNNALQIYDSIKNRDPGYP